MSYITFQPSDHFNTKLYTGNGSTQSISSVGFQPDLVWLKGRSGTGRDHLLFDVIRGATNYIKSNATSAESTISSTLTSFDSDGFSIGSNSGINTNSETFASWNWLANGSGSANTDGSISSTVSANTTSGFSIVKWVGSGSNATIGHSLGVAPKVVIIKNTSSAENWVVGHSSIGFTNFLQLNTTAVEATASNRFNDTAPTSSVFSVGTETQVNKGGDNMIAYVFAEKKGFSKMGLYNGNSSTDGTFVYTGFKPSFVLLKAKGALENWRIFDNKRIGYNPANYILYPSGSFAEDTTGSNINFLSNGFKLTETNAGTNASGQGYIFMAFASEPLVSSNDIPATAR